MQIVIDIPDTVWNKAMEYGHLDICGIELSEKVMNGTPLPKGHGRLGDLDNIWSELKELEEYYQTEFLKKSNVIHVSAMGGRLYGFTNSKFIVQDAPTIIEADKAESEVNE